MFRKWSLLLVFLSSFSLIISAKDTFSKSQQKDQRDAKCKAFFKSIIFCQNRIWCEKNRTHTFSFSWNCLLIAIIESFCRVLRHLQNQLKFVIKRHPRPACMCIYRPFFSHQILLYRMVNIFILVSGCFYLLISI